MVLTILTPVYNRKECILTLFDTLLKQTVKGFDWLIVDDGSTDGLKETIEGIKGKADFSIKYIYKENSGKHTALNIGIAEIESDLTFIVDSDDWLTNNAVETILKYHNNYKYNKELSGYAFLRQFPDGTINGKKFKQDELIASYIETRINDDDTWADKTEVFFTKCLKEFPFPEYNNEKFLGEDIVWIRMARKYKLVHINEAIYVGNYQDDGLTKNRRAHNIASPIGCMHRAEEFLGKDIKLKYRIKGGLQYIIYGKFAGYKVGELVKKSHYKAFVLLCVIPAVLLYCKWKSHR
jgi:hypothetical protein